MSIAVYNVLGFFENICLVDVCLLHRSSPASFAYQGKAHVVQDQGCTWAHDVSAGISKNEILEWIQCLLLPTKTVCCHHRRMTFFYSSVFLFKTCSSIPIRRTNAQQLYNQKPSPQKIQQFSPKRIRLNSKKNTHGGWLSSNGWCLKTTTFRDDIIAAGGIWKQRLGGEPMENTPI